MEVVQVLHMIEGEGEKSYAKNSSVQRKVISIANPVIEKGVVSVLRSKFSESLGIADLGCSSGPNTLIAISKIIDVIDATSRQLNRPIPELRVSLNDLPGNDFNYIFKSLPEFHKKLNEEKGGGLSDRCFVSGVAGSFYGRLFPTKSLHFIHSSSSLHWLSQVPPALNHKRGDIAPNKGKIFLSKTSPPFVVEAYISQFQKDFSLFLKSRAQEMVPGGRMVLQFMGRRDIDPTAQDSSFQWEIFAEALMFLASEGKVTEEKIDSFNVPYYAPCPGEVKLVVETEGSFLIDHLDTFDTSWDDQIKTEFDRRQSSSGQQFANTMRAACEPMLEYHFGRETMDPLFRRYGEIADVQYFSNDRAKYVGLVVSLVRKE